MFCKNCGSQIDDNAVVCPHCGVATDNFNSNHNANPAYDDIPNAVFAVLSFLFPIIGLILYLIWHSTKPQLARLCGKSALIAVILYVVVLVICSIILAVI